MNHWKILYLDVSNYGIAQSLVVESGENNEDQKILYQHGASTFVKPFKPVMTEIMNEGHSVQILDVDENKSLAQQYNVRSVPTTVIEENGVEVDRFVGGLPKESVIQKLNEKNQYRIVNSLWEQCPYSWKLQYVDNPIPWSDNIHTLFGTGSMKYYKNIFV